MNYIFKERSHPKIQTKNNIHVTNNFIEIKFSNTFVHKQTLSKTNYSIKRRTSERAQRARVTSPSASEIRTLNERKMMTFGVGKKVSLSYRKPSMCRTPPEMAELLTEMMVGTKRKPAGHLIQ